MARSRSRNKSPVWSHGGIKKQAVADEFLRFCAGRDVASIPPCDAELLLADLATNEASAVVLTEAGVFSQEEASAVARGLLLIREKVKTGEFELDPALEDVHINIEHALTEIVGPFAGKIHSGRSRNDQVACDLRLWHRVRILDLLREMISTVRVWIEQARKEKGTVMPGYSHHQRAFVTTWGHLLTSYAQAWLRDVERGLGTHERVNRSPLGAAAGYGTSWPLDRERLAELLGFEGIVENSLDAVTSRLEVEQDVAAWLVLWMQHCSAVAQDLILYSMEEFRWVRLAVETTTGSSIMPQKRNPDFAEVIKGKTAFVEGSLMTLLSLGKGQPSGYHRDTQLSKPVGQDIWREVRGVPGILRSVFLSLRPDRRRMKAAARTGFLEAAEWADAVAQNSGLPFRRVYRAIGRAVDRVRDKGRLDYKVINTCLEELGVSYRVDASTARTLRSPESMLERRRTAGSPNPEFLEAHLETLRETVEKQNSLIQKKIRKDEKSEGRRLDLLRRYAENG